MVDEYGLGAIPSPPDPRDYQLDVDTAIVLPSRFLSAGMPPVLNQGLKTQCVPYSAAAMKMWQENRDHHGWLTFDEDWLYAQARAIDGVPDTTAGTTCRAAQQIMLTKGYALLNQPATAIHYRTKAYYAVPMTYVAIKAAIKTYGPVQVATKWYTSWSHPPTNGVLPAPSGYLGGHAMLAFGWDDSVAGGALILRNSWGKTWGVNGNCYAPIKWYLPVMHDAWKSLDIVGD